jgi:hypothetical protein
MAGIATAEIPGAPEKIEVSSFAGGLGARQRPDSANWPEPDTMMDVVPRIGAHRCAATGFQHHLRRNGAFPAARLPDGDGRGRGGSGKTNQTGRA